MITVKKLIQTLEKLPQDMEVVREYDSSFYELFERDLPKVQSLAESEIYDGTYYESSYGDKTVKKVCI